MKKILNKIGQVLRVVMAAPVHLPGKAMHILKYVALGLGILETVLEEEPAPPTLEGEADGGIPGLDKAVAGPTPAEVIEPQERVKGERSGVDGPE